MRKIDETELKLAMVSLVGSINMIFIAGGEATDKMVKESWGKLDLFFENLKNGYYDSFEKVDEPKDERDFYYKVMEEMAPCLNCKVCPYESKCDGKKSCIDIYLDEIKNKTKKK